MDSDPQLLAQMLGIEAPWEVKRHAVDSARQRLEIWIGLAAPRNWFGFGKPAARNTADYSWRHLPCTGLQTTVHVAFPLDMQPGEVDWQGDAGLPFTHALARRLAEHFSEGLTPVQICRLCGVEMDDLWKYKFARERGRSVPTADTKATTGVTAPVAPKAAADVEAPPIVPENDPIWAQLANGSVEIDIRALGLKLLLTRVRNQVKALSDRDVLALKQRELYRFFVKNAPTLAHEADQLRALIARAGT
ncbi:MAG: hypothetical protein KF778_11540 [Rhodocyclaceae bacterium]|nr:hypothetical protein [Rhodocyclaceae bacterium]MBX3669028.1 hypothetical protein [Rhodocyclaceae bacterium]